MAIKKQFDAWLLDVSAFSEGVILWVKTIEEKKVVKIFSPFSPEFFAVLKKNTGYEFKELLQILESHQAIKAVRPCEKYVRIEDHVKSKIFGISVEKPSLFKKTIEAIDELGLFTLYNTDLPISQMYFYVNDLFPVSFCHFRVKIKKDKDSGQETMNLHSLELRDNNETLFYKLPPLRAIWLDARIQKRGLRSYYNEPLEYVEIRVIENEDYSEIPRADGFSKRSILIDKADEAETLKTLSKTIEQLDPDIILTEHGDEFLFPYLVARASVNHISKELYFSRDKTPLKHSIFNLSGNDHYMSYGTIFRRSKVQVYFTGRFHLDTATYASLHFSEGNIPGIIEVARISRVPLQRLCRITIGGALQSIQYYNAYKLDHLIPPFKKSPEDFRSGMDLIKGDRGGHIFEPKIGVFDQVVELDFSSMYPSLMAYYNISSETLNCKCCKDDGTGIKVPGLDFHICSKREGIISKSIKLPLEKRLDCKKHVRETGSIRYKFMDIALKWVLVVSFGYLGFRNARFGKIEAHQTVCAFAREFLMRSAEIARAHGCKVIHGIVDSVYLQDTIQRPIEEFEEETRIIAEEISKQTRIPMSWDGRFNVITFLPSRAEPDVPTLNHYWGIKSNGELKARGVEVRRRDMPRIIKDAQYAFFNVFKDVKSVGEFMEKMPEARQKLYEYVDKIKTGKISRSELTIRQRISRKPSRYKVNSYQAIAARQTERSGKVMSPGSNVRYIILNADADPDFPERKVILSDLYDPKVHQYDKDKYIELLKRSFENIFPFKFERLESQIKSRSNRTTSQTNLSCFIK